MRNLIAYGCADPPSLRCDSRGEVPGRSAQAFRTFARTLSGVFPSKSTMISRWARSSDDDPHPVRTGTATSVAQSRSTGRSRREHDKDDTGQHYGPSLLGAHVGARLRVYPENCIQSCTQPSWPQVLSIELRASRCAAAQRRPPYRRSAGPQPQRKRRSANAHRAGSRSSSRTWKTPGWVR